MKIIKKIIKQFILETLKAKREQVKQELIKEIEEIHHQIMSLNVSPSIANKEAQSWYVSCGEITSKIINKLKD